CGKALKAEPNAAGKKAKCPSCGQAVRVPSLPKADDSELSLVPLDDLPPVGELPRDSRLQALSTAPPPRPTTKTSPLHPIPSASPRARLEGSLATAFGDEEDEPRLRVPAAAPCPACAAPMPSHAVVCLHCGHNRQTGVTAVSHVPRPPSTIDRLRQIPQ